MIDLSPVGDAAGLVDVGLALRGANTHAGHVWLASGCKFSENNIPKTHFYSYIYIYIIKELEWMDVQIYTYP